MGGNIDKIGVVSPHLLKLFDDCPMKFYYRYIEQIPAPTLDKGVTVGSDIHAIASYYLKKISVEKFESVLTPKEAELWNYLKKNQYFTCETVGVEKYISIKLDRFWIGGRIDAIVKDGDDYFILDYKTGGVKDDMTYDAQTMVYMLLCDELINLKTSLSFVYLDLKNKREVKINFNEELKKEYKNRLLEMCQKIDEFKAKSFVHPAECNCEYSKLCLRYL